MTHMAQHRLNLALIKGLVAQYKAINIIRTQISQSDQADVGLQNLMDDMAKAIDEALTTLEAMGDDQ